jgi:uncharacterized membrane protein
MVTSTTDVAETDHMTQQKMDQTTEERRKRVRRTVTILVLIVAAFFLVSFVQIVLMK